MSQWFKQRRQEFITATLRQFGQINRGQIAAQFEVSQQLASSDIQTWLDEHPDQVTYDLSAKCYVFNLPEDPQ